MRLFFAQLQSYGVGSNKMLWGQCYGVGSNQMNIGGHNVSIRFLSFESFGGMPF